MITTNFYQLHKIIQIYFLYNPSHKQHAKKIGNINSDNDIRKCLLMGT